MKKKENRAIDDDCVERERKKELMRTQWHASKMEGEGTGEIDFIKGSSRACMSYPQLQPMPVWL